MLHLAQRSQFLSQIVGLIWVPSCLRIWTELRPQSVVASAPRDPLRYGNSCPAQQKQSGFREGRLIESYWLSHMSTDAILQLTFFWAPDNSFNASATCIAATTATIGPMTPAVSQVWDMPAGGVLSNMQRRHALSPGIIGKVSPYAPTHAPYI